MKNQKFLQWLENRINEKVMQMHMKSRQNANHNWELKVTLFMLGKSVCLIHLSAKDTLDA